MSDEKPLHVRVGEALGWTPLAFNPIKESLWNDAAIHEMLLENGWTHLNHLGRIARVPRYDTDWSATGPLIAKYRMGITPRPDGWTAWQESNDVEVYFHPDGLLNAVCGLILLLAEAGKLPRA